MNYTLPSISTRDRWHTENDVRYLRECAALLRKQGKICGAELLEEIAATIRPIEAGVIKRGSPLKTKGARSTTSYPRRISRMSKVFIRMQGDACESSVQGVYATRELANKVEVEGWVDEYEVIEALPIKVGDKVRIHGELVVYMVEHVREDQAWLIRDDRQFSAGLAYLDRLRHA